MTRSTTLALAIVAGLSTAGCYDEAALVDAHREETSLVKLDEIDMGEYRISLPSQSGDAGGGVVSFHVFGQATRRDHDQVTKLLKQNDPELRRRILLVVRGLKQAELDEPRLDALRGQILQAANAALDAKLVKKIGFYRFSFSTL